MSLRSKILPILSLSLGLAFSTAVMAQEPAPAPNQADKASRGDKMGGRHFGDRHGMRGGMRHFALRGIELTDAQKAQIKSIHEANRPDPAVRAEMKAIRDSRRAGTELTAEQKDRIKAFRQQALAKARTAHEQILAVLTPEQKAQIESRKGNRLERLKDRKGRPDRPARPAADKPKTN